MTYTPKNMLVTGGAGFIGCNFIRHVLATHEDIVVVNLDLLTYAGSMDNLRKLSDPQRHIFVQGDICDQKLVERLLCEHEIDTIVHFAAESHVDRSIEGPAKFVHTNVMGTFTLLEAARQYWLEEKVWNMSECRFHHISTDEVYGTLSPDDPPFTEQTPFAPNSPYSASKASSDHMVRAYQHTYQLPTTITNCSNNYGPYQHEEKFIPTVIKSCAEQLPIPIYGDGSNIRDWLYVEDHCRGIDIVIRKGSIGETYNIGGCNEWANIDICKTIGKLMDGIMPADFPYESLITYVKDRPGHDWRYAIDQSKIKQVLHWWPEETFESGIQKTLEWYLDNNSQTDP